MKWMVILLGLILAACASGRPATDRQVTELSQIAGTWQGKGSVGSFPASDVQWIIRPDGSYVGTRQPRNGQPQSGTGQIRLENGALVVESANFVSEVTLQENGTHRMLVGTGRRKSDGMASWVELEEVK